MDPWLTNVVTFYGFYGPTGDLSRTINYMQNIICIFRLYLLDDLELFIIFDRNHRSCGGVAQMVERSLSMREVPGSIPGISKLFYKFFAFLIESFFDNDMLFFARYESYNGTINFIFELQISIFIMEISDTWAGNSESI